MLGILRKELVGNIVSFYELDEIMIKHGYQSELAWINDEGLWDDILKDKNICYKNHFNTNYSKLQATRTDKIKEHISPPSRFNNIRRDS